MRRWMDGDGWNVDVVCLRSTQVSNHGEFEATV